MLFSLSPLIAKLWSRCIKIQPPPSPKYLYSPSLGSEVRVVLWKREYRMNSQSFLWSQQRSVKPIKTMTVGKRERAEAEGQQQWNKETNQRRGDQTSSVVPGSSKARENFAWRPTGGNHMWSPSDPREGSTQVAQSGRGWCCWIARVCRAETGDVKETTRGQQEVQVERPSLWLAESSD